MASVRKRRWVYKGEVKTTWIADYFDAGGVRRQKTFRRKKEADDFLVTARGEIRAGTHTADSVSKTVAQAGELWIREAETGAEPLERSTVNVYRQHLKLHITPFIGAIKLSQLTAPGVHKFLRDLRDRGRSEAMVRKVRTSLVSLLNCAQQEGWVAQNVAASRRRKRGSDRHRKRLEIGAGIPTKTEIRTIIDKAPERWRPMILTAIFTGMRASELRGLKWENVDLEGRAIRVTQRADAWGGLGSPKSKAGRRTIPLAPVVVNTLKEWKLRCPVGNLGLVFPNNSGGILDYSYFYRHVFTSLLIDSAIVDDAGKPRFTFHALRHVAASLFIEQGWPPKRVQDVMGHSSITVTYDTYGHLFPSPEDDHEAMEQIEARLLT